MVVTGALLSRDGSTAVMSVEGPHRPRRAVVPGHGRPCCGPGSTDGPAAARARRWSRPTLEFFHGRDGLALTGWLYRPPGQIGPGPAMLSLHGGPEAQERPTFSPQHQAMVAAGITVFAPNIRGSSGFGRAFVHADDVPRPPGRLRRRARQRGTSWSSWASPTPDRIAVTGRSYGGYLTLAALAFSPGLFAAGVDICGMSDLHTFYRDTEPWIAAAAYSKYGHPEDGLRAAARPSRRCIAAENIDVPLLVVHGELDTNVPIGEAQPDRRRAARPRTGRWSTWSWTVRATSTAGQTPGGG